MYKLLGAVAAIILAYLAGQAKTNERAAKAYNKLRDDYLASKEQIDQMPIDAVDDELADRLRGGGGNNSNH